MKLLTMLLLLLCIGGCGGGGGGEGASSQTTDQSASTPQSPKFKVTPILSGKGEITQLTVSGTNIFWSDGYAGKGIWKYTRGNSSPQLLVPMMIRPSSLVVRGNFFYWVSNQKSQQKKFLYRTSLDGTETTILREGDSGVLDWEAAIVVDDTAVYWKTNRSSSNTSSIEKIPMDGSTPQTLLTTSRELTGFTTDGNFIYWLENIVGANPNAAILYRVNNTGGSPETVCESVLNSFDTASITYSSNSIIVGTGGKLLKIPASGGIPFVLAEGSDIRPFSITVNQGQIYWINYTTALDAYSILSTPLNGGSVSVVASGIKNNPANLLASSVGLYWTEYDPAYTTGYDRYRVIKKYSWNTGVIDVLATGIYFSSFDIAESYIYFTEFDSFTEYGEIARLPHSGGVREPLIGGVNTTSLVLTTTPSHLLIGDVTSLKKVPIEGGVTKTLLINGRFEIRDIREQNGTVFFTSSGNRKGVYKISLEGGSYVALAEETGLYGKIISAQEGYVYYLLGQSNGKGGANEELRRVPISGGVSESVFKLPDGTYLAAFDGVGTVYWEEWIWNDQYKLIKYDISTGKSLQLSSGSDIFIGFNSTSVFVEDSYGNIRQIPINGGVSDRVLNIPYPLSNGRWVNSGENFYFSVSYLDDTQGYISEIDFLEQLN